jgi:hypothetical protein
VRIILPFLLAILFLIKDTMKDKNSSLLVQNEIIALHLVVTPGAGVNYPLSIHPAPSSASVACKRVRQPNRPLSRHDNDTGIYGPSIYTLRVAHIFSGLPASNLALPTNSDMTGRLSTVDELLVAVRILREEVVVVH